MNNYFTYPVTDTCIDACTLVKKLCIPKRVDCNPTCTDYMLQDCFNSWNCNLCQGECKYAQLYDEGDKIQFQLRFVDEVNVNPEIPTLGWGDWVFAELCDNDGVITSINVADFASQWLVGWDGNASYQLIEIDTSLINLDCFSLRFYSNDVNNNLSQSVCTFHYEKNTGCKPLVKVRGIYPNYDCCGNYYGLPIESVGSGEFIYNNEIKVNAILTDSGGDFTKTLYSAKAKSVSTQCIETLSLCEFIPPNVKNTLVKQLLAAEKVLINDIEYDIETFTVANGGRKGRMFIFSVPLTQTCEVNFNCN